MCWEFVYFLVGFVGFVFRILFPINYVVAYDSHCFCNCNISQCYPKVGPRVSTHCINQHTGNQQQFAQITNRFCPYIYNKVEAYCAAIETQYLQISAYWFYLFHRLHCLLLLFNLLSSRFRQKYFPCQVSRCFIRFSTSTGIFSLRISPQAEVT